MGHEGQQPPPEQGGSGQQGYYGWQYDQEAGAEHQQSPAVPQSRLNLSPSRQQPPAVPASPPQQIPPQATRRPQMRPQYQQPIQDMGTSLGYGQGMEYQYFDAPQPSQPMAQLRQDRLQQLREERMRRQQRRMGPDITTLFPWGGKAERDEAGSASGTPSSASWGPNAPPSMLAGTPPVSSPIAPNTPGVSPSNDESISPIRASTLPPASVLAGEKPTLGYRLKSAATPAQDTGMLQKVRVGKAAMILTGAFVASRILGLFRTSMFAYVFGTGTTSDAYLQAFLIPDLIFNIVAGGALSSAFIPVFTKYLVGEKDEKTAWHLASSALNLAIAIMGVLALIAIIFARQLVPLYNPGTSPERLDLIANLTRIMLLQAIVLGAGVIINAVLNARQNFLLPAIGTVVYNVGLIVGLFPGLFFAVFGQRNDLLAVYFATWGVVIGALLQVAVQIPGLFKVGMRYTLVFDWKHIGVVQIGRQMIPRILNASMLYVSIFVDRYLISLLSAWAIAVHLTDQKGGDGLITQYYQSLQLMLLPLGIFGMAVSTAAFPTLAENVAKGRLDRVRNTILETVRSILFMSIPSSFGLIVLGFPVIQVLLQHGRFSLLSAYNTSIPLGCFAVGLGGLAAVEILTRSFYALRDSITPVIVSVGQFVFKIALSLLLINLASFWGAAWGMGGLALSTSIAGLLEAAVLFWLLHQRLGDLQLRTIGLFIGRVVLASFAMLVAIWIVRLILDFILVTTHDSSLNLLGTIFAIVKLAIELFVGMFVYIRVARLLGIEELGPVKRVLDRLKLSWI